MNPKIVLSLLFMWVLMFCLFEYILLSRISFMDELKNVFLMILKRGDSFDLK